ncbi:MAG: response regulator [Moraxellaceae bacterium]|nr:response regulator [Moraxellaceae bacterium]
MNLSFLVIDDDEVFRQTLSRGLQRHGCQVAMAADEAGALALLSESRFDACVLDLRLDDESGLMVLPRLLALQSDLRILMLTGYSSIATAVEAIKRGASHYLAKPATIADILRVFSDEEMPACEPVSESTSVDRLAWEHIQRVLLEENGNISASARRLGMHRRTLQRRLAKRPVAQ